MSKKSRRASAGKAPQAKPTRGAGRGAYWITGAVVLVGIALMVVLATRPSAGRNPQPGPGSPIDGIRCEAEMVQIHFHAHLSLIQDGAEVPVPGGIGISHTAQCLYWLHTHSADGIIHIESSQQQSFTLGQFFDIWGQPLNQRQAAGLHGPLRVFADRQPYSGDPRNIVLAPHQVITIEAGQTVPPPDFVFPSGV